MQKGSTGQLKFNCPVMPFVRLFGLLLRFQFEIHMININGSSFISISLLSADGCISALLQIG